MKISCFDTTAWLPNTTPLDVPYAFYLHIYARDNQSPITSLGIIGLCQQE